MLILIVFLFVFCIVCFFPVVMIMLSASCLLPCLAVRVPRFELMFHYLKVKLFKNIFFNSYIYTYIYFLTFLLCALSSLYLFCIFSLYNFHSEMIFVTLVQYLAVHLNVLEMFSSNNPITFFTIMVSWAFPLNNL